MIVLDTNVISEAMRPSGDVGVVAWLNEQPAETLYLTSVTLAELLFEIGALPSGRRKDALATTLDGLVTLFDDRVLAFDTPAAKAYAEIATSVRGKGKGLPTPDGYIAAIAASREFAVATRDTSPFEAAGLTVINPWEEQ
ncbi:MAG: VapC toxin family PIN domain ribonuclease [Sphingobium sp.]|nr:VapC toxin family PIN domain ribonuclease [Sphingobium sp.]